MKKIILVALFLLSCVGVSHAVTLDELRALINTISIQADELDQKANNLRGFMHTLERNVHPDNPFLPVMFPDPQNVDDFVNIQVPIYIQKLTDIEVAADALGTDPYNP